MKHVIPSKINTGKLTEIFAIYNNCFAMYTKMRMLGMTNRGFKDEFFNFIAFTPRRNQETMLIWKPIMAKE